MKIVVYSTPDCGRCKQAKKRLEELNLSFEEADATEHISPHDGWLDDDSMAIFATYQYYGELPVIQIGDRFFGFKGGLKKAEELAADETV